MTHVESAALRVLNRGPSRTVGTLIMYLFILVIRAKLPRALTHCAIWAFVNQAFKSIRSMLVSRNFSLRDLDKQIKPLE